MNSTYPPHADQSAPEPPVGRQNPAIFSKDNDRYLKEGLGNSGTSKTQWEFLDEFFGGWFCGWNLQWGLGMQSILRSFFFDGRSLLQQSSHNSAEDIPEGDGPPLFKPSSSWLPSCVPFFYVSMRKDIGTLAISTCSPIHHREPNEARPCREGP